MQCLHARCKLRLQALCLLFVICISLQSCVSSRENQAIEEGYSASKNAEILSSTPGPQILNFGTRNLKVIVPAHFTLRKAHMQNSLMYSVLGSKGSEAEGSNLNIYVISPPAGEDLPQSKVMFDGMLNPYRKRLGGYEEAFRKPIEVNGNVFENAFFRGNMFGTNIKGFVCVSRRRNAFIVFCGSADADRFSESESVLLGIVKSCKIKGE